MGKPNWENPSFFKIMIQDFTTTLRVPPLFKKHIEEVSIRESCFIRNYRRLEWKIKMGTLGGNLFFLDGWESFVKDNGVSLGDFLVFFYDGDSRFDVKIYANSCCEKKGSVQVPINEVKVKEEEEEGEEGKPIAVEITDCNTEDQEEVSRKRKRPVLRKNLVTKSKQYYNVTRAAKAVENEKALKAAHAINVTNPHFIRTCRNSHADHIMIPKEFAREHNINQKEIMHLLDPSGTSWPVNLSIWQDGRPCLSSGWVALYRANNLEEGDVCVFEILPGYSKINVHIFRVQEYSGNSIPESADERILIDDKERVLKAPKFFRSSHAKSIPESGEGFLSEDNNRALQAAYAYQSSHANFVCLCRPSHLYHMPIPKKVALQVGIKQKQSTILIDPSGSKWPVQIAIRANGLIDFGIGWINFVRGNKLALGDACVFEFIGRAEVIEVHIFRTGEPSNTSAAREDSEQSYDEKPVIHSVEYF